MSGVENVEKALQRVDELELVLNHGSFTLKGITFTGADSPSALSADDSSIIETGMKWFPKEDLLALDIGELNFAKNAAWKKTCTTPKHTIQIDKRKLFQKWLESWT